MFNFIVISLVLKILNQSDSWKKDYILKILYLEKTNCKKIRKNRKCTFMILHWATPVTVNGTPWAVSTISQHGFNVITSSDNRCTSVTSHQAHAHPPTIVRFRVEPQHPPVVLKRKKKMKLILSVLIQL